MKKDIILIMSDQHNGRYTSMSDTMNDVTPELKSIANQGTYFPNTYCNAPLCVPSRMSFLSGKLPSDNGVLDNDSTLNSDVVTIAHKMSLEGYKTILVGRMHFKGVDQYHGFDERYLGDITTQFWGQSRENLGDYYPGFKASSAQTVIGVGQSPVLDFDRAVFNKTQELLNESHDKPLFIIVGFYAPHFPYVSSGEHKRFNPYEYTLENYIEEYNGLVQSTTESNVRKINSIYQEMIYEIDAYVGTLFRQFEQRKGLFIYTSDHGDQLGKRGIFGKKTLYEDSIRIPLVLHGVNISGDINNELSLLDLHKLLIQFAKTQKLELKNDVVKVQSVISYNKEDIWTEAVIKNRFKLARVKNSLYLFDLEKDYDETTNLLGQSQKHLDDLFPYLESEQRVQEIMNYYKTKQEENKILIAHGKNLKLDFKHKKHIFDEYTVPKSLKYFGYEEE